MRKVIHHFNTGNFLISHKGHNDTIQVYSVTVMTHVIALEAGQSSNGDILAYYTGTIIFTPNYPMLS